MTAKAAILDAAWGIAHEDGLSSIGMRELGGRLNMAASSLYGYFDSKNAIYDAMFEHGNIELRERFANLAIKGLSVREALILATRSFVEFCDEDHPRFQLLFQHSMPGWEPSADAYAVALDNYEQMRSLLANLGIDSDEAVDLWTALTSGLASQQVANDPGGDRWLRLVGRAVDMYISIGRNEQ